MKRNSTPSMGAFHPVLFFMFIYGISLLLAIFVCRTVYNILSNSTSSSQTVQAQYAAPDIDPTALR